MGLLEDWPLPPLEAYGVGGEGPSTFPSPIGMPATSVLFSGKGC